MDRVLPGIIALVAGAALAVVLIVPFVAISYRRRGGLTAGRTLAWTALLVWVLGLWAYTLLPLPDPGAVNCVGVILDPLEGFRDVFGAGGAGAAQQLLLNVALFVPWGVLVRALWRRGWIVAGVTGFAFSLGIELTQLTGVWGLYPCAYRFFDTGDLVTNTSGAILGSLLGLLFFRGRTAPMPAHGDRITLPRRLLGMLCDALVVLGVEFVVTIGVNALQLYGLNRPRESFDPAISDAVGTAVAFLAVALLVVATGTTPGESAVRLEGVDGRRPVALWRAVRYLAGIGGFVLLGAIPVVGGILAAAFAVVTLVLAWRTDGHRGLAGLASGMRVRVGGASPARSS
ncbi:VanZ family protein [Protaetiibacter intestinalis]|nr:VanZ family protein [Protaetiibacter intestinalis]